MSIFITLLSFLGFLVFILIVVVRVINLKIRHEKVWDAKTKRFLISSIICFVVSFIALLTVPTDSSEPEEATKIEESKEVEETVKKEKAKRKYTVEDGVNIALDYAINNINPNAYIMYLEEGPDKVVVDVYEYEHCYAGIITVYLNTGDIYYDRSSVDESEINEKVEETGQCYDCGEYYPVNTMTFNGRSYHCGCYAGQCANCGCSVFYEGYTIADEKFRLHQTNGYNLCSECYEIEQLELYGPKCDWCTAEIPLDYEAYTDNGERLCSDCNIQYHDTAELNKTWICPTCGRENKGEVLCECEVEALN